MVGHAALAFALGAGAAVAAGLDRDRALLFGAAAGGFGLVPDVDIGYAVVGLFADGGFDPGALPDVFWETGNVVHRGLTHSLVVGVVAALLFGLLARRGPVRGVAAAGLAGMVALTLAAPGALEAGVMLSFLLAGAAVALGAGGLGLGLGSPAVAAAALVGLLSHPFGDVFTGTSPTLLYPLDVTVLPERVLLSEDPTLHLLGAFGAELVALWLAVVVYFALRRRPLQPYLHRRAVLGTSYASAVVLLPLPTLAVSYQFVVGVLAVGVTVALVGLPGRDVYSPQTWQVLLVTGLAAVSAGWLAYLVVYRVVG